MFHICDARNARTFGIWESVILTRLMRMHLKIFMHFFVELLNKPFLTSTQEFRIEYMYSNGAGNLKILILWVLTQIFNILLKWLGLLFYYNIKFIYCYFLFSIKLHFESKVIYEQLGSIIVMDSTYIRSNHFVTDILTVLKRKQTRSF